MRPDGRTDTRMWRSWYSHFSVALPVYLKAKQRCLVSACGTVMGRDSSVGIATRYGLDGPEIEFRWGGGKIFRTRPDRPWGLPSLLYIGYRVFPGGKAAGTWCYHTPPSKCRDHERVGLYLYSPSGPQWPVIGRSFTFTLYGSVTGRVRQQRLWSSDSLSLRWWKFLTCIRQRNYFQLP